MFTAENLSLTIGKSRLLSNISLTFPSGQLSIIIGANGASKSTLLKVMTGELTGYEGSARCLDREIRDYRPVELAQLRAVLPQASRLAFPFTVLEVVRLGLTAGVSGRDPKGQQVLPHRALERVDLAGYAGRYYQSLSGGEQQRVHLARVLCQLWEPVLDGQPRFLFLDEPTSSLDIRHQLAILEEMKTYKLAGGGVVAIVHDLNIAAMYADQLFVLKNGHLLAQGPPGDVLNNGLLYEAFGLPVDISAPLAPGTPYILPQMVQPATGSHPGL